MSLTGTAAGDLKLVTAKPAAATGEDGRMPAKARPLLLAAVG
jgi:hypothetical protein